MKKIYFNHLMLNLLYLGVEMLVHENCGVIGIFSLDGHNVIPFVIDSLRVSHSIAGRKHGALQFLANLHSEPLDSSLFCGLRLPNGDQKIQVAHGHRTRPLFHPWQEHN